MDYFRLCTIQQPPEILRNMSNSNKLCQTDHKPITSFSKTIVPPFQSSTIRPSLQMFVHDLVWRFYDFYHEFWINRVDFKKRYHVDHMPSHLDLQDYMYYVDSQLEEVKAYLLLLQLFGELSEEDYNIAFFMISEIERKIEQARQYFHRKELTSILDTWDEKQQGKPVAKFHAMVEHLFKPAFFINPVEKKQHPNINQIYSRLQTTIHYT